MNPPLGRELLILFNSLVRPPLRCGRCRTALVGVLTRPLGGSYSSYLFNGATSATLRSPPDCPCGRPYPPVGRESLILFRSLVRPPLRCDKPGGHALRGRRRTALRASLPAPCAGVTHLI